MLTYPSRWRLTVIESSTGIVELPRNTTAGISFSSNGTMLLDDGVNITNARYLVRGQTITVTTGPTTAVGYCGDDPTRLLAIAAVGHLSKGNDALLTMIDSSTLEVTVDPYKFRLTRTDTPESESTPS